MSIHIDNKIIHNRLFLGTALYPNLTVMEEAISVSNTQVVTVSLRRQLTHNTNKNTFWETITKTNCHVLPNTAGCHSAKEAIMTAKVARDLFETNWIKLEVIGDELTLQPDCFELVKACEQLLRDNFIVFPYCTDDLIVCQHLVSLGCRILMPWAAPIGSGKGLLNPYGLKLLRLRFPECVLIIDAGIGTPSHAAAAMELGFDGVLLNTAVALADDPVKMALAFSHAVTAGRLAYEAGRMPERDFAHASTPLFDKPLVLE
jgi:thiazole synthase